jgi:hypothetical protein
LVIKPVSADLVSWGEGEAVDEISAKLLEQ